MTLEGTVNKTIISFTKWNDSTFLMAIPKDEDNTEWLDWIVDDKKDQELQLSYEQELTKKKELMNSQMI